MRTRLNKRSDTRDLCDTNCVLLSLGEAVARWTKDGQFMMTEVNGSDAYQSRDNNIDIDSYSHRLSKIEATLAGMDFNHAVKAPAQEPSSTQEPASAFASASE